MAYIFRIFYSMINRPYQHTIWIFYITHSFIALKYLNDSKLLLIKALYHSSMDSIDYTDKTCTLTLK